MAKMLGKLQYSYQRDEDDPLPKARVINSEERQWRKDVEAEGEFTQDCPHGLSVRETIAGLNACLECWCLARGLDPATTEDYEIG